MSEILNVAESFAEDNAIESFEVHSYRPYVTTFNKNDEIRIPINQQDLYVLPSSSTLYLEGTVKVINRESNAEVNSIQFTNNPFLFLFQDIRYELNGVEIDKVKNVGVTTTIKSLLSMNSNESSMSKAWGWDFNGTKNIQGGRFAISLPLNKILGFAEDYTKIIMNCKHELILLRSNTNLNAVKLNTNEVLEDIILDKIVWRVPHIKVSDRQRIQMLKLMEKDRSLNIVFRNWDLYEYPLLPKTTKHTWAIKTSSQLEKPRFMVLALSTDRKQKSEADFSRFDHCNLREVRVFLNSTYFPYENLNVKFEHDNYALLYEQYTRFQQSYHGRRAEPLLNIQDFKSCALFVLDTSRQNDRLKTGPIDVRIEIESDTQIPDNTSAFCLIFNDCIVEYKPLSGIVKKIS